MPRRHAQPRLLGPARYAMSVLALCCVSIAACAEAPDPVEEPTDVLGETAAEEETVTEPGLRPFLPDEMRAERSETFPHDSHVEIDCAACHAEVTEHGSHTEVECAECHRASALSTVAALTQDECQACHHAADQTLGCAGCHATAAPLISAQVLTLGVWEAPRARDLTFEHDAHDEVGCTACHQSLPATEVASCADCHEDHHRPDFRCSSCHEPAAEGAHDLQVHLGCSGAGCHTEPLMEEMLDERTVCLSCHEEQQDHEPQGDCVACHQVRGSAHVSSVAPHEPAFDAWRHLSGKGR